MFSITGITTGDSNTTLKSTFLGGLLARSGSESAALRVLETLVQVMLFVIDRLLSRFHRSPLRCRRQQKQNITSLISNKRPKSNYSIVRCYLNTTDNDGATNGYNGA